MLFIYLFQGTTKHFHHGYVKNASQIARGKNRINARPLKNTKKKFCYLKIIKIKELNWLNLLLRPVCQSQGEQPSLRNISPDEVQNCKRE